MASKIRDYSVLDKFNFERKPVGVKYSMLKPEGIELTDKRLALCELFAEAHDGKPYCIANENIQCGQQVLGISEYPPMMYSGQLGSMYSMFKNAGANRRIYDYVPHLPLDSIKYISHATYDRMEFEPDLLVFTTNIKQAVLDVHQNGIEPIVHLIRNN